MDNRPRRSVSTAFMECPCLNISIFSSHVLDPDKSLVQATAMLSNRLHPECGISHIFENNFIAAKTADIGGKCKKTAHCRRIPPAGPIRPAPLRPCGQARVEAFFPAIRKGTEAVEKLPPVSESLRCAENLYFHYYKRPSFCLSLYFGPRLDGPH